MTTLNPLESFLGSLCSTSAKTLFEKSSPPWTVTVDEPAKAFPAGTRLLSLELTTESPKGKAAIQLSIENAAVLVGELSGTAAALPAQLRAEHAEAIRESLARACEAALQQQTPGAKCQVAMLKTQPGWATAKQVSLSASNGASGKIQFQLLFSQEWLKPAPSADPRRDAAGPRPATESASGIDAALLRGVELQVTLRFGQRQMTLRQISELATGSVIELDKQVQEPAELLLGDRVIARGEVVVVDGSYGLRVTEMP